MSLPNNYKKVEYIQSSGSQYINTEVEADLSKDKIDITYSWASYSGSAYDKVFGASNETNGIFIQHNHTQGTSQRARWGVNENPNIVDFGSIEYNKKYNAILDKNGVVCNDVQYSYPSVSTVGNVGKNIFLFALNSSGSVKQQSRIRLFSCKIYEDNVLVRDYVPVERNDGVLGLYDIVNDVFYTNAGTGTFTKGAYLPQVNANINPINAGSVTGTGYYNIGEQVSLNAIANSGWKFVNWLLKGYTQLEYIESTGTQYIDVGFNIANTSKVETTFQLTQYGNENQGLFGAYNTTSIQAIYNNSSSTINTRYCGSTANVQRDLLKHHLIIDNTKTIFDDIQLATYQEPLPSETRQFNIFRRFSSNTALSSVEYSYLKIFDFKIWKSDILIRDFIPVIRHYDGAIGLLDLVNLKFYGNSGTGEFIGGNAL